MAKATSKAPKGQELTPKELNRATLARQMLLARETSGAVAAVERLAGLQAQLARPPFIGLWSRIEGFRREDLVGPLQRREVVRATMMRCTLHLVSASDYLRMRPALGAVLAKSMRSVLRERAKDLDVEKVSAAASAYLAGGPRTFEEIRDHLETLGLPGDIRAKGYAVRTHLPLVQVPVEDTEWGFPGTSAFTSAETWLGERIAAEDGDLRAFVKSYLAAFGPATPVDAQTWSGFASLRETFESLRPELVTFRDERGRELFDLPGAPRPPAETPAPVRFLPEFDSLVLAHDDRTRLIADEHRPRVSLKNLQVLATFLVDGIVTGTWKIEKSRGAAVLALDAFEKVPKKAQGELVEEGNRLLRFVEPEAKSWKVDV